MGTVSHAVVLSIIIIVIIFFFFKASIWIGEGLDLIEEYSMLYS